MHELPSIEDELHFDPTCPICLGTGLVCEDHPGRPWGPSLDREPLPSIGALVGLPAHRGVLGGCHCGAAGMPCPAGYP